MADIATVVGGGTPSTTDRSNFAAPGEGIAWITPADLSGYVHKVIVRGDRDLTSKGLQTSGAKLMPTGSVLFSSRAPIGYVAVAGGPVSTNQGFKSFVPAKEIQPDFLYYYLQRARNLVERLASGTTFKEVSGAKIATLPIALAGPAEQERIVESLESLLSKLDAAVVHLERAQVRLKAYRASLLKAAVEGRLVPTEAELARAEKRDYEPADVLLKRILAERRRRWEEAEVELRAADKAAKDGKWKPRYSEPADVNSVALSVLPEGWCWVRLDAVSEVQLGQQRSPDHASAVEQLPYVRAANITWAGLDLNDVKTMGFPNPGRYRLRFGDVLLSEASGSPMEAGKPAIWRDEIPGACYQKTLLRVRVDDARTVLPEYLRIVFLRDCLSGQFARLAPGVGIVHLTAERMLPWPIPLPPYHEQRRIVEEVERLETCQAVVSTSAAKDAARCMRLRQAILKWAFDGKLVDQDPREEPAVNLLARITTQRVGLPIVKRLRADR